MDDFEVSISLPLDSDGFIRRECPNCTGQFKWHDGPANEEAERQLPAHTYYCPLCGQPADPDSWWTREQLDFMEGTAAPAVMEAVDQELEKIFKGVKSSGLTYTRGRSRTHQTPMPLTEPDDMEIVTSPCHSYEPVKVPMDRPEAMHCLICGKAFMV